MNIEDLRVAGMNPVVRIAQQPVHLYLTHVLGKVCVVRTFDENLRLAHVVAITNEGALDGGGWVPIDCLEFEPSPVWLAARDLFVEKLVAAQAQMQDRGARRTALVESLANQHHLEPEAVEVIYQALDRFG